MSEITLTSVIAIVNLITSSANVIIASSLFVYIAARNVRNAVARGFVALMFFVAMVYAGDVILSRVGENTTAAIFWLRFQWIGIALVPAAYWHFSDALLRTTNVFSVWRRLVTFGSYLMGLVFFLLAVNTTTIVRDEVFFPFAPQFAAGPYFWVFGVYFVVTFVWGLGNTLWARHRCLTVTSRRRMTYLLISFAAPALAVFPYLLVAGSWQVLSANVVLTLSLVGNMGIATMMMMMAYAVSYYGSIEPDRAVKRNLIKYLIQAPLMGTAAIGMIIIVPRFEQVLGLPQDSLVIFAAIIGIIAFQMIVSLAKPLLDWVSDWEDRREVAWLQRLDERLLTRSDALQLLENILAAMCDLARARQGCVMVFEQNQLKLEAAVGARGAVLTLVRDEDVKSILHTPRADFVAVNGAWLRPLFNRNGDMVLGLLAIGSHGAPDDCKPQELQTLARLARQAERTLEDRRVQAVIVEALQELRPELESLQRYRSVTPYVGSTDAISLPEDKTTSPEFPQWVREALNHYWGGPKLSESPLLELKVVREAMNSHELSPTKALRAVLYEAIELLRPEGEPDLNAREWILYNILRMKIIEGKRIREIVERLAMSESDFYRKQRLAIEEVARTLATMEQSAVRGAGNGNGTLAAEKNEGMKQVEGEAGKRGAR
jgi:hypothetical protein